MIECRRKGNVWLPYGNLIMKILMHVGFNLELKECIDNSIKKGGHNLGHMQFQHKRGVLVQKDSNAMNKGSQ